MLLIILTKVTPLRIVELFAPCWKRLAVQLGTKWRSQGLIIVGLELISLRVYPVLYVLIGPNVLYFVFQLLNGQLQQ